MVYIINIFILKFTFSKALFYLPLRSETYFGFIKIPITRSGLLFNCFKNGITLRPTVPFGLILVYK